MKNLFRLSLITLMSSCMLFAGSLTGIVKEASSGMTLPNARVTILGTTYLTLANAQGQYTFKSLPDGAYRVQVTFPGFASETVQVDVAGETTLDIGMEPSNIEEAIIVTANRAIVRETPVAFSNVTKEAIQSKYTTQDTPELLKQVPGVFSRSSGLGESDLYVRGFDSERVQIMINNVPVNDPESQVVYWSNWTGLSGNAADIQVQRGVGSSLYGSGAFGGSVNIMTENFSVDQSMGLVLTYGVMNPSSDNRYGVLSGSNSNYIGAFEYSTGFFNDDKDNFYFRYERKAGDWYIDDTYYDGHSFYFGFMHMISDRNSITINFHGAPQEHNQAGNVQDPVLLQEFGRTWNRRGHPYQENYYFKPVFEVHHDWVIDTSSHLRTTFFYTQGDGGGKYLRNDHVNLQTGEIEILNNYTFRYTDRNYDPGSIYNNSFMSDSENHHVQFGFNTSYKKIFSDLFTMVAGAEARIWDAEHYSECLFFEYGDEGPGKPATQIDEVERRYDYDGDATNYSVYARGQISPMDNLDIMLDVQYNSVEQEVTENAIRQYDFYNRVWTDIYARASMDFIQNWDASNGVATATVVSNPDANPDYYTRDYDFVQPKLGINYNINDAWNIFLNYSTAKKEPKVGDWYNRYSVPKSIDELKEEELTNTEIGIAYRTRKQTLSVNVYQMKFEDKIESIVDSLGERDTLNAGNADHDGVEVAYNLAITNNWTFASSWTFADNTWSEMADISEIFGTPVDEIVGKHVPGTPETIFYNELSYRSDSWHGYLANYHWDDYYVLYDNSAVPGLEADGTIGALDEWNLGLGYAFDVGGNKLDLSLRMNNLFAHEHYLDASWARDYGRDGQYHLGVTQAPKLNYFITANYKF